MSVSIPGVEYRLRVITCYILVGEIVSVFTAGVKCQLRILTCCVLVGEIMSVFTAGEIGVLCTRWQCTTSFCTDDLDVCGGLLLGRLEGQLCILLSIGASLSIIAEN